MIPQDIRSGNIGITIATNTVLITTSSSSSFFLFSRQNSISCICTRTALGKHVLVLYDNSFGKACLVFCLLVCLSAFVGVSCFVFPVLRHILIWMTGQKPSYLPTYLIYQSD